jgi:glycosyltransferase involved in cell wall biosynthesis
MVEPLAHDISRGIMEMLDDKQSWPLMSENALKLVKELLNWQVISESLIQEYRTCIERVRQD